MAKTKQKNKNLGTDILYRIIMAAMAVCVPIVAYFGNLVYTVIESDIYKLVAKLKGDSNDDGTSYDYWSIKRVVSLVHEGSGDKGSLWTGLRRELSELFVVRPAGTQSPRATERLERARRYLAGGMVDQAIAEVEAMPGAADAGDWLIEEVRGVMGAAIQHPARLPDIIVSSADASIGAAGAALMAASLTINRVHRLTGPPRRR